MRCQRYDVTTLIFYLYDISSLIFFSLSKKLQPLVTAFKHFGVSQTNAQKCATLFFALSGFIRM